MLRVKWAQSVAGGVFDRQRSFSTCRTCWRALRVLHECGGQTFVHYFDALPRTLASTAESFEAIFRGSVVPDFLPLCPSLITSPWTRAVRNRAELSKPQIRMMWSAN